MDRGAWWAVVHKVAKSQTQLKRLKHSRAIENKDTSNSTKTTQQLLHKYSEK